MHTCELDSISPQFASTTPTSLQPLGLHSRDPIVFPPGWDFIGCYLWVPLTVMLL
jgi:hypothetical protein